MRCWQALERWTCQKFAGWGPWHSVPSIIVFCNAQMFSSLDVKTPMCICYISFPDMFCQINSFIREISGTHTQTKVEMILFDGRNPAPTRYFITLVPIFTGFFFHPRWWRTSSIGKAIGCLPSFCMTAADMTSFNSSPAKTQAEQKLKANHSRP